METNSIAKAGYPLSWKDRGFVFKGQLFI